MWRFYMMIDRRLVASRDILELIELNKLLAIRQQQLNDLQQENNLLKKTNAGLKNRLQLLLRHTRVNIQAGNRAG
jgi:FtsZ-binding cell division protein ZapB